MSANESMPEIQQSYVAKFLRQHLGDETKLSSKFRSDFSKSLSIFIYYLMTMATDQAHGDSKKGSKKNKKITKTDLINALNDMGFEEISEQIRNYKWKPKSAKTVVSTVNKKRKIGEDGEIPVEQEEINNQDEFEEIEENEQVLLQQQLEEVELESEILAPEPTENIQPEQ